MLLFKMMFFSIIRMNLYSVTVLNSVLTLEQDFPTISELAKRYLCNISQFPTIM